MSPLGEVVPQLLPLEVLGRYIGPLHGAAGCRCQRRCRGTQTNTRRRAWDVMRRPHDSEQRNEGGVGGGVFSTVCARGRSNGGLIFRLRRSPRCWRSANVLVLRWRHCCHFRSRSRTTFHVHYSVLASFHAAVLPAVDFEMTTAGP